MKATRRDALRVFGLGGALVIGMPALASMKRKEQTTAAELFEGQLTAFIRINPDNSVTIGAPVPDMGTGIETALPMIVAEELDVTWDQVSVERMPFNLVKDDEGTYREKYTLQGTGGSGSVRKAWPVLRDCGALARDLLLRAAAKHWRISASQLETNAGYVRHSGSGQRISYADLLEAALALPLKGVHFEKVDRDGAMLEPRVPQEAEGGPRRKAQKGYQIVGTAVGQENIERLVRGEERFGIDLDIDGQLHAVIERCPFFDGDVKSFDASEALEVEGVRQVIKIPGLAEKDARNKLNSPGVAVIAVSQWAAMKGREVLKVTWDEGPNRQESEAWQRSTAKAAITDEELQIEHEEGDFDRAFAAAETKLEATYTTPHFAHLNMEPITCSADVKADRALIRTSHQFPPDVAQQAAKMTGLEIEQITVETGRIGCGFGRKFYQDFVAEAVYLSQQVSAPVKVFWNREDDVQHDFLNPSTHVEMQAGLDSDGKLVAWHTCSSSRWSPRMKGFPVQLVPNVRQGFVRPKGRVPLGPWRGPGNNTSGFSMSCFMDEVAHAMGRDPLEVWLELLGEPRELPFKQWIPDARGAGISTEKTAAVLTLAAEKAGWGEPLPDGWGRGIAAHFTFGGYAAFVVDVRHNEQEGLVVERVVGAAHCGMIINLSGATAQMESGVHDGLSTVLHQHVRIEGGRITSGNFDSMPLLRIDKAPRHFEMHFVESHEEPWGTGEIALPAFIPALMNAVFDATGKRIRDLPIGDQLVA